MLTEPREIAFANKYIDRAFTKPVIILVGRFNLSEETILCLGFFIKSGNKITEGKAINTIKTEVLA